MNNDLISREALKKAIAEYKYCGFYDKLIELIDNAPSVEPEKVLVANVTFDENKLKEIVQTEVIEKIKSGELVIKDERPQGEPVIKCQDCKYRVKEWREDKRMKEKGYWVYGCKHFGEIMGYWGFGGNDNEFCSDAEQKGSAV